MQLAVSVNGGVLFVDARIIGLIIQLGAQYHTLLLPAWPRKNRESVAFPVDDRPGGSRCPQERRPLAPKMHLRCGLGPVRPLLDYDRALK